MELKPCPFCGKKLELEHHAILSASERKVYECYKHVLIGCILDGLEVGDEQEANMWNRRADNG